MAVYRLRGIFMISRAVVAVVLLPGAAWGVTPADCPSVPAVPGATMTLQGVARLGPGPAMPRGGYAGFSIDQVPTYGTVCETAPPDLPRDVLHGDTSTDVLSGQPTGQ